MSANDDAKHLRAVRDYLSAVCDEASTVLDSSPPAEDRQMWGARLRLAQEIAQKIDAGDFLDSNQSSTDTAHDCEYSKQVEALRKEILDLRRLLGPYSTVETALKMQERAVKALNIFNSMKIYQVCPRCAGTKLVSKPPWIPADQLFFDSFSSGPWSCNVCSGSGFVQILSLDP